MSARGKRPSMNGLVIFRYLKEASRPECFLSILLAFHQENGCVRQTTIWLFDLQEIKAPRTSGRRHSGAQKRKGLQDRESEGGLGGMEMFGGVTGQRLALVPWPPARLHMTFRLKTLESSQMSVFSITLWGGHPSPSKIRIFNSQLEDSGVNCPWGLPVPSVKGEHGTGCSR